MFISPEVKGDLSLEQAEFQSMVSGEDVSIARKNQKALSKQWNVPGILAGNEVPNWRDNSGSVQRRVVTVNFSRQVADADPHLDDKLEKEIPAILCKCVKAYLEYSRMYSDQDIWNVLPKYFKDVQKQIGIVTNTLLHFLESEKVEYGSGKFVPQKLFVHMFNHHCQENNLQKSKFNPDVYAGPFSQRELEVRTEACAYRGRQYAPQPVIYGVDIVSDIDSNIDI
jgi:phage/plasmid-associated DNA primase